MRKKLVWTSIISLFLSLVSLLIVAVCLVDSFQKAGAERSLRNYLAIAESYYDPDSSVYTPEKTRDLLANSYSDVRLTIVGEDGTVKIDTNPDISENHLSRPEIQHPGTIVYRRSASLNEQMIYLAGVDKGSGNPATSDYVRVAFSVAFVEQTAYQVLGYGFLGIALIVTLGGLTTRTIIDRSLSPLQHDVNELSEAVGEETGNGEDVSALGEKIGKAKALLDSRYQAVEREKKKYESLLDSLEQGLIALDSEGKIMIINPSAAETFTSVKEKALGQSYRYLSIDPEFISHVEKTLREGTTSSLDFTIGSHIYYLSFSALEDTYAPNSASFGAIILSLDVTEKRKLESAKRDFFANASHELKTPLTAIIGYQELLENGTLSSEKERAEAGETTLKEARRMKEIISQMLIISKLESGAKKKIAPLNLKALLEESLVEYGKAIQDKGIKVTLDAEDTIVSMDAEDARNLVFNLVENGIKYNKDGGSLALRLHERMLSVKDTGIGIAKENQSRVFERFYRVDVARSNSLGGTGLGLAIVKHICIDYGFRIVLESTLGLGSEFRISFPTPKTSENPILS